MIFIKSVLPAFALAVIALIVIALTGASTATHPPSAASPSLAPTGTSTTQTNSTHATETPSAPIENPAVVSARNLTVAGGNLLRSTVNILCTAKDSSVVRGASGSGVIIDSRGLILTAAHIGQYFLFADGSRHATMDCVIRTGSPASDAYTAALVYLSPSWLSANPDTLIEKTPKGTGQDDFAVLAITGSAAQHPLPPAFNFIPLGTDVPKIGEKLAIGAYAAQYLSSATIQSDLYPTIVFDSVTDRYTFDTNTVDVLAIKGTAAAQEGSSGGALVDEHDQVVGLITTSSITGDISEHTLNAITPRHIRASFLADTGTNIDTYLASHDLPSLIAEFSAEAKTLRVLLAKTIAQ